MPSFNYVCDNCGNSFTLLIPVSERNAPLSKPCASCEGALRRTIGNDGGFRLGTKGKVSWAKGGYSTLLGDVWKSERR